MAAAHLTKETFNEEVLQAKEPVLVDFWATWCGPCQMVLPIIEELAGEVKDAKICKVNVDEQPELAKEYRVMSIPTLMVFKAGEKGSRGKVQSRDIRDVKIKSSDIKLADYLKWT